MTVLRKSIVLIPRYEKSKHLRTIFEDFKEMSYLSRRKLTKYQGIERGEIKSLKIQFEWSDEME